jgi:hypothetical protein
LARFPHNPLICVRRSSPSLSFRAVGVAARSAGHGTGRRAFLVFFAVLPTFALLPPAPSASDRRVVAVGDVHGDFDAFTNILRRAGLLDDKNHWAGGDTLFVQVGDFTDRGPKVRRVMDLLMRLEEQAPASGGRVVVLLGNHEMMNVVGDLRYLSAEDYAGFADGRSERRRRDAYRSHQRLASRRGREPLSEAEWMDRHPPGFVEHREAFARRGRYGRWLRRKPAVFQHAGVVFVHGGISPTIAALTADVDEINKRVQNELQTFDLCVEYLVRRRAVVPFFTLTELVAAAEEELSALQSVFGEPHDDLRRQNIALLESFLGQGGWYSIHPEGPLWFRGLAEWPEERSPEVDEILQKFGASHFVVGHTVQPNGRIHSRFSGRAFLIDTGMLSSHYLGGRASALEIQGDRFTAIYEEGREVLGTPVAGNPGPD